MTGFTRLASYASLVTVLAAVTFGSVAGPLQAEPVFTATGQVANGSA